MFVMIFRILTLIITFLLVMWGGIMVAYIVNRITKAVVTKKAGVNYLFCLAIPLLLLTKKGRKEINQQFRKE